MIKSLSHFEEVMRILNARDRCMFIYGFMILKKQSKGLKFA